MEGELGYNSVNTLFSVAISASPELSNEESNSEDDDCCDSGCGCHDAEGET